jgi:hypothetical protein
MASLNIPNNDQCKDFLTSYASMHYIYNIILIIFQNNSFNQSTSFHKSVWLFINTVLTVHFCVEYITAH